MFSPAEVAEKLGVTRDKVMRWIRSGELVAVNLATSMLTRPRFRVQQCELDAFLNRRKVQVATPTPRRPRKVNTGEISFCDRIRAKHAAKRR